MADYNDIYASTVYLFSRKTVTANPKLPELIMKAHAEAIKRFYDDKAFAVKAYIAYDKQDCRRRAHLRSNRQGQRDRTGSLCHGCGNQVHVQTRRIRRPQLN